MAEQNRIERLDAAIEAILGGRRENLALADPELATLLLVAGELHGLPDPEFKARLKRELVPPPAQEETMTTVLEPQEVKRGINTIVPYFILDGGAEFITFLVEAFDAEELGRVPAPDGKVMHAEVRVGNSLVELSDARPEYPARRYPIHLYVPDADAAYAKALRAGATSLYEPDDRAYGDREGGVTDRWGNQWYIGTHQENVAFDEVMRRFEGGKWSPQRDPSLPPQAPGFRTVNVGLRVVGAMKLYEFMRAAFDARWVQEPELGGGDAIRYSTVRIGDSVLELGDPRDQWEAMPVAIHLFVDDPDRTYDRAIAAGATSLHPVVDQPYGERSGSVSDPFGNQWYIAKVV